MSLMKYISDPPNAVHDALTGLKSVYPSLTIDKEKKIVISNGIENDKVGLVSGGGSGHEPFSSGYVGEGMLSAAVSGLVFVSPPAQTILTAIRTVAQENNNSGVLVLSNNYTGDVLNFGLAVEGAKTFGIKTELVVFADDCATLDNEKGAGQRGISGIIFGSKIAGNMARLGKSLTEIAEECREINSSVATLGASVSACTVPGVGRLFEMKEDEIEIGLGVHGEAGFSRIKRPKIDELVEIVLNKIIATLNLPSKAEVCVMVNNMGSVSALEAFIINGKIHSFLTKKGYVVRRQYNGWFITALDMAGFHACVLNVTRHPKWIDHLDSPTDAPAWNATCMNLPLNKPEVIFKPDELDKLTKVGPKFNSDESRMFEKCLRSIGNVIIKEENHMNDLDRIVGDGDTGSALKKFTDGIVGIIPKMELDYPAVSFHQMAKLCENVMGGTSGALYGLLLHSAAKFLISKQNINWAETWKHSLDTLGKYSKAKIGDRTMVDVLLPACNEFDSQIKKGKNQITALDEAVEVANVKLEETKHMTPKVGRASYVPKEYVKDVDPGAYGVKTWLEAILNAIKS